MLISLGEVVVEREGKNVGFSLAASSFAPMPPISAPPPSLTALLRGRTTTTAHAVWRTLVQPGAVTVDATAGNGLDTLELARLAGPSGRVFAFDTAASAVAATLAEVEASIARGVEDLADIIVLQACHSTLADVLASHGVSDGELSAAVFNLGWLPGAEAAADRDATATRPETTLAAVAAATSLMRPGGFISMTSYIGHEGGREEVDAVRAALAALPPKEWVVARQTCSTGPPPHCGRWRGARTGR